MLVQQVSGSPQITQGRAQEAKPAQLNVDRMTCRRKQVVATGAIRPVASQSQNSWTLESAASPIGIRAIRPTPSNLRLDEMAAYLNFYGAA